jgi:hypothetical protein
MLLYSRAIPEGEQEPLQWPEDIVVRGSAVSFFLFLSYDASRFSFSFTAGGSAPQPTFP